MVVVVVVGGGAGGCGGAGGPMQIESIWAHGMPVLSFKNSAAAHMCSYLCFTSMGSGEERESLCYFGKQGPEVTGNITNLCDFPEIVL